MGTGDASGGGGEVGHYWNATTDAWFKVNPQMFLNFPYSRMDFRGVLDMGLPVVYVLGPTCMIFLCFFYIF